MRVHAGHIQAKTVHTDSRCEHSRMGLIVRTKCGYRTKLNGFLTHIKSANIPGANFYKRNQTHNETLVSNFPLIPCTLSLRASFTLLFQKSFTTLGNSIDSLRAFVWFSVSGCVPKTKLNSIKTNTEDKTQSGRGRNCPFSSFTFHFVQ